MWLKVCIQQEKKSHANRAKYSNGRSGTGRGNHVWEKCANQGRLRWSKDRRAVCNVCKKFIFCSVTNAACIGSKKNPPAGNSLLWIWILLALVGVRSKLISGPYFCLLPDHWVILLLCAMRNCTTASYLMVVPKTFALPLHFSSRQGIASKVVAMNLFGSGLFHTFRRKTRIFFGMRFAHLHVNSKEERAGGWVAEQTITTSNSYTCTINYEISRILCQYYIC